MRKLLIITLICFSFLLLGCDSNVTRIKINSTSMEPDFKMGEVYEFKKVDPTTLIVGDIIAYEMVQNIIVVSKISRIAEDNNGTYFIVKSTQNSTESLDRVRYENIIGVYRG